MQYRYLNILALTALATAATTSYEVETVTDNNTVEVTVTSCSGHPDCTVEKAVSTDTTVTKTVNGVLTVYTTECPLTESAKAAAAVVSSAAAAASSSEEVEYVDVTTTPTVTASTGVELTTTLQSTLLSTLASTSASNSSSLAAVNEFEGAANKQAAFGVVGLAGLAAVLL